MKQLSIFLMLALFTLACQDNEETIKTDAQLGQNADGWTLPDGDLADIEPQGDPYDLDAASLEVEVLTIETSYVGGCKEHLFKLRWPDKTPADGKPIPALLVHDNQGDMCEAANIPQTFTADLSAVTLLDGLETYKLLIVNASQPEEQIEISSE